MLRIAETIADVRYVTNPAGDRTDVIVPLPAWETLLTLLEEMAGHLEDRVDAALLQNWLAARSAGTVEVTSLSAFEEELCNDGLLPS